MDRLFELHHESYWKDPAIVQRMNAAKVPVIMQRKVPAVDLSAPLPLEEMVSEFRRRGFVGARYFTSTIAYMIAYALYLNMVSEGIGQPYDEIALYGVHMSADEEYGMQRQSMEYWTGVANGMGVRVVVPVDSTICSAKFLYGYDEESTMLTEMRKMASDMQQGLTQAKAKVDTDVQTLYEFNGALKILAKMRRLYS